jgi:D-arabinose 1-dehydrogenase-like Zn-dependent alcohol dehydrogenase
MAAARLGGLTQSLSVATIFSKNLKISGVTVGSRGQFEEMVRAIEANDIHPVIDRRFPLEAATEAFGAMQAAQHYGKLVLDIA